MAVQGAPRDLVVKYEETDVSHVSNSLSRIYLEYQSMPSLLGGAILTSRAFRVHSEPPGGQTVPIKKGCDDHNVLKRW